VRLDLYPGATVPISFTVDNPERPSAAGTIYLAGVACAGRLVLGPVAEQRRQLLEQRHRATTCSRSTPAARATPT
jgi:hypothetical protein